MKTLALTGATGFIGRTTIELFLRHGWNVKALYRTTYPDHPNIEWIKGDLSSQSCLDQLTENSNLVIHLAGIVESKNWQAFQNVNVDGTERLVESSIKSRVDNFLLISSLAATKPDLSKYGKSKFLAENIVKSKIDRHIIIRPPAVCGQGDRDFPKLFEYARKYSIIPQTFRGKLSIIDVHDLANLFLCVAESADFQRDIFEPDDGKLGGWSHVQLTKEISRAMRRPILPVPLPKSAFYSYAAQQIRKNGYVGAQLTPDRARYFVHKSWVSNPDLAPPRDLWQPNFTGRHAIRRAYEAYRDLARN